MSRKWIVALFVVLGLGLAAQGYVWHQQSNDARRILSTLRAIQDLGALNTEKAREEATKLRLDNELRAIFGYNLVSGLAPLLTAFVALLGALVGLQTYLATREKERIDREKERVDREEGRAKDRRDRLAADLKSVLELVASQEPRERAVGIVGLQNFFSPDYGEYHLQALSALVTAARMEQDSEVQRGIVIAAETALAHVPDAVLRQVSWQGVKLKGADFRRRDLTGLDLRDAVLENAALAGCTLVGARLNAAKLNGANLDGADLTEASLDYADLAGASLAGAILHRAILTRLFVQHMDLNGADLTGAVLYPTELRWEMIANWRLARFDPEVFAWLIERYGPDAGAPRILMLMWEIPPLVAGGTWTACYHLVRNLRRRGASLTICVPWDDSAILPNPWGTEVEVVPLGIPLPEAAAPPPGMAGAPPSWSPYGWMQPPSSYAAAGSVPAWGSRAWSGHSGRQGGSPYTGGQAAYGSPYGAAPNSYGGGSLDLATASGAILPMQRLTTEFRRRVEQLCAKRHFDVVHAHDWVTFEAGAAAARVLKKPWIAHFHSTETDRRVDKQGNSRRDPLIVRIEHAAVQNADAVVVPSTVTSTQLAQYDPAPQKVAVIANSVPLEPVGAGELGSFEDRRVVYLGRLTPQKGPDLFADIAAATRQMGQYFSFVVYGDGEMWRELEQRSWASGLRLAGPLDWDARGAAFARASAIVVPSRSEPFGMVILEAMLHRVPVLYPANAGAAEVLQSGIRIDPTDVDDAAEKLLALLGDLNHWRQVVEDQTSEIEELATNDRFGEWRSLWQRLDVPTQAAGGG
jgi:glycosyltransferase involved in cell wall biosynthesis